MLSLDQLRAANGKSDRLRLEVHNPNLILKFEFVRAELFEKKLRFPYHSHSDIEIHFIADGSGEVELGEKKYALRKGDFFVTAPGMLHAERPDPSLTMTEYVARFYLEVYSEFGLFRSREITRDPRFESLYQLSLEMHKPCYQVVNDSARIGQTFESFFLTLLYAPDPDPVALEEKLLKLLALSVRNLQSRELIGRGGEEYFAEDRIISRVDRYLDINIHKSVKVGDLAEETGLNVKTLYRLFKRKTGRSPQVYILSYRCEKALMQITGTDKPLNWISDACGFSDNAHLSRSFKAIYGRSPKSFRINPTGR